VSDLILKLSVDLKILEFNSAAEIFFGTKREDALNTSFIKLLIHGPVQKKTEKELIKILDGSKDCKYPMVVLGAGEVKQTVNWSVKIILNPMKMPAGMILTTKLVTYEQ